MKAVLLAAGLGTRLRPLTDVWPKCLMPIRGKPLLEYWLDDLAKAGIRDVLVNLHHHSELVSEFLARPKFGRVPKIAFEKELLGTAGTLRRNAGLLASSSIFMAHADNWCRCELSDFLRFHTFGRPRGTAITMMTFETDNPRRCGIVDIDNDGVVQGFFEKVENPPGNLANAAVYILEPEVLDWLLDHSAVSDFSTGVLPAFVGRIATWKNSGIHRDIGDIAELKRAQLDMDDFASNESDVWSARFAEHPIHMLIRNTLS